MSAIIFDISEHLDLISGEVKKTGAKSILLQFPEGLLKPSVDSVLKLEKEIGCEVLLYGGYCFGACDLPPNVPEGVGLIVQFGHGSMEGYPQSVPVLFIPVSIPVNVDAVAKSVSGLDGRLGLITTVQYAHALVDIANKINSGSAGTARAIIGGKSKRGPLRGVVLGCDVEAAESISADVDLFVFIGDGLFHPVGVSISLQKTVFAVPPSGGAPRDISPKAKRLILKRYATMENARGAKRFGILVSSKWGQNRESLARRLKSDVESAGKEAVIIISDTIMPERISYLSVDAIVSTACPRLPLDDAGRYAMPVLTPKELVWVLEGHPPQRYSMDTLDSLE